MTISKFVNNIEDFSNRKIVLTGGTSGIGLELLKHLISKNATIVLLARNLNKARQIIKELNYKKIDVIEYDQSSFSLIEKGIDELLDKHPDFDTIVLNAGELAKNGLTAEGYSLTIGVNYVGVRHFIEYLSPKLVHPTKIVVQGSVVASFKLNKKSRIECTSYGSFRQYNVSKIYLEAYIHKLLIEPSYSKVNFVLTEPGVTSTNITQHYCGFVRKGGKIFLSIFFHSAKKASLPLLLAISEKSKNGDYIVPRGFLSLSGFPKYQKFAKRRERSYLF